MSILTSFITFVGCKSEKDKFFQENKIIYYGTTEFKKFEKNAPIKLDEAWNIQKDYAKKNNQISENWLFFSINDYYVFNSSLNPKESKTFINGIWVNSKTGEVRQNDSKIMLNYKNAYNGDGEKFPF